LRLVCIWTIAIFKIKLSFVPVLKRFLLQLLALCLQFIKLPTGFEHVIPILFLKLINLIRMLYMLLVEFLNQYLMLHFSQLQSLLSLSQLSGTEGNLILALLGLLFQLRVLDDEVRELPPQFLISPLDLNLSL